jgi:hypothetical protein
VKHELGNLKQTIDVFLSSFVEDDYRVDVKNQTFHTNVSYRNPCNIVNHQTNSIYKALTK